MSSSREVGGRIEAVLHERFCNYVVGTNGLEWAEDMPDDDPDADLLVVDEDGQEYEIDIYVSANPTSPEQRRAVQAKLERGRRLSEAKTVKSDLL